MGDTGTDEEVKTERRSGPGQAPGPERRRSVTDLLRDLHPDRRLSEVTTRTQDKFAISLGVEESGRTKTVMAMLANNARRAPAYWIQLVLSAGIATLGLVLNSTAVVIGAMLVSPLMGPIIELGMGFAVGSSLLVMRATVRVIMSVAVAVLVATILTLALPFHEVTSEVSTRAAPTALDLMVAIFIALTAAYTTVRPGADSTAAAAGTAIGIALVPPLCAVGFGLGTALPEIAGGAALLFTANLSAILLLSVLSFLLLGFNQVDANILEHDFIEADKERASQITIRIHLGLRSAFGSRYGMASRLMIPFVFLAAVFVPLRRALHEVTWEVTARDAVRRIVAETSPGAVQTQLTVERHSLSLRLLVVGQTSRAIALEDTLIARVRRATGVKPTVTVIAVPNARTLIEKANRETQKTGASRSVESSIDDVRRIAATTLPQLWPQFTAGPIVGWSLSMGASDSVTIGVRHIGPPLDQVNLLLLGRSLSLQLHAPVSVQTRSLRSLAFVAQRGRESAWLDSARVLMADVAATDSAVVCVTGPIDRGARSTAAQRRVLDSLKASPLFGAGRVRITNGPRVEFLAARATCS